MNPENWSEHFIYSPNSLYLGFISHLLTSPIPEHTTQISPCIDEKKVHPHIKIKLLEKDHPLAGQRGVFATQKIPANTQLGEYVGEVFLGTPEEGMFPKKEILCWHVVINGIWMKISSQRFANELVFVNDYRGIQESPNAKHQWVAHLGSYYFGYVTTRDIEPGEEILVNYGLAWENILKKSHEKQTHPCPS